VAGTRGLKTIAKVAAVPLAIAAYVTVSGLTGFCPTCEVIVDSVGDAMGLGGGCALRDPTPSSSAVRTVAEVPASTRDGEPVMLSDFLDPDGAQPMLIEVWATYCPPCRTQRETLRSMQLSGVTVVAIAADRSEQVEAYLQKHEPVGIELLATDETLAALGGIRSIPVLLLVSADGRIRDTLVGAHSAEEIRQHLALLR
jgi:thiol-disulfide isomerase/thioredoxin